MKSRRPYGRPLDLERDTVLEPGPLETPCRVWRWAVNGDGYPRVRVDGKVMPAHRVFWSRVHGNPGDWPLDHLCCIRRCCEPSHLELVPQAINTRRANRRRWKGESH